MKNNSTSKFSQKYSSEAALLLMVVLWGATFVIIKESLDDISSMLFIAIRFMFASLFLAPFLFIQRKKLNKNAVLPGIILGLLTFSAFAAQTVGLKYTSATKSAFLTGTAVVMIPIFQFIIEKKKPSRAGIAGTSIVFIGILFLSSGGDSIFNFVNELGANFNAGDWLTLLCAALFALYVIYIDVYSPKYDFWVLVFLQIFVTSILGFITAALFYAIDLETLKFEYNSYLAFALFYTAFFTTFLAVIIQTKFQKNVTPTKAGIIYSFEPIFAAVFAFFLLNEKITNFGLIGSSLIFAGLILSEVFDNKKKRIDEGKSESRN